MKRHLVLAACLLAGSALAQLSAPVPLGTGPGVHGPNGPCAPLPARADVVAWSVLTDVKTRVEKNRVLPVFAPVQLALNQKTQRVQGFMIPLDVGDKQKTERIAVATGRVRMSELALRVIKDKQVPKVYYQRAMPTSYLIDREGTFRKIYPGSFSKSTVGALKAEIEEALK